MAIGIGSLVTTANAAPPVAPCGLVIGGSAGVWEVRWADGTVDPAAVTAGLTEVVAAAPIVGTDPVAGDLIAPLSTTQNDPANMFQSTGNAANAGANRLWLALKLPQNASPQSGLPWALRAANASIRGHLPQ